MSQRAANRNPHRPKPQAKVAPAPKGRKQGGRLPVRSRRPARSAEGRVEEHRPITVETGPVGSPFGVGAASTFDTERIELAPQRGKHTRRRPIRRVAATGVTVGKRLGPGRESLLHEEHFRIFWLARLMAQTAQGALLYALLILVVDRTDRSIFTSLFVVCSIIPAIAFGLPGGLVSDNLPRRFLLVTLNLLRFVFMLSLIVREPTVLGLFAATLGIWTIHQFYSPTESATLAALVPRERYVTAQALSNLALTLAQLTGLVILAPLLLRTLGPSTVFAVCGALFIIAAGLTALLPRLDEHLRDPAKRPRRASLRQSLLNGWRTARSDRATYEAVADDVLVGIGMSALVVIMPFYLERVLGTAAENTVFVFAPAALGLVLGLRYAPLIGRIFGVRRVATGALMGFAACVGALGFVEPLHTLLYTTWGLPLDRVTDALRIPPLVLIAMLLSVPAGFASALVNVTARSIVLDRTAPAARGQVIATQGLLGNVGALAPTMLAGVAADLFGVEPIAVAIALLIAGGALAAHTVSRRPVPLPSPSS